MRILLILVITIVMAACSSVSNYNVPKYQIGQTFQNSFVIGIRNTNIPLPEGIWKLVGYQQQPNNIGKTINHAFLIQTDGGQLSKFVEVLAPDDHTSWGYLPSKFCNRDDVIHIVARKNQDGVDGGKQDCWGINHWRMTWSKDPMDYWKQFIKHVRANDIKVPINALVVVYRKANKSRFVQVSYGFNPELEGFTPPVHADWNSSDWHKDRYYTDQAKVKYISTLKEWSSAWESKVNAGFSGQIPREGNQVVNGSYDEVTNKLNQLKKLLADGVITDEDYDQKKQELLDSL